MSERAEYYRPYRGRRVDPEFLLRPALAALFGGRGRQRHSEPDVAQGEERLGRLECRSLADEAIVRLILDGTVVRVRLDRKATAVSLLVVLGVRDDGQKVLLAIKSMGRESAEERGAACSTI